MPDEKKSCCSKTSCCSSSTDSFEQKVTNALGEIRPLLQRDGGDIELVEAKDGAVKVKLTGACGGCPMAKMTLKRGVEVRLKQAVPEVQSVESV